MQLIGLNFKFQEKARFSMVITVYAKYTFENCKNIILEIFLEFSEFKIKYSDFNLRTWQSNQPNEEEY